MYFSPGFLVVSREGLVPAQVCSYPYTHLCFQLWLALTDALPHECLVDSQGNLDISQSFGGEDGSHVGSQLLEPHWISIVLPVVTRTSSHTKH